MARGKKILICPLDWGLGHATRCIPIIRSLTERGAEVCIASSGPALDLLRIEFPTNAFFELPSYNPEYGKGSSLIVKMLRQLPKFRKIIAAEHRYIEELARTYRIDIIISDNRYGCYASGIESIFITHQLSVVLPEGYSWAGPGVNWALHQYIKKFNRIWIPDQPNSELTMPFYSKVVQHQQYIGWLSRFDAETTNNNKVHRYKVIAILSGPEPQRSILEKKIRAGLSTLKERSMIVLGKPGSTVTREEGNLTIANHLSAEHLQRAIQDADIVVSRSGYSTVMDLIALKKNAIFIPTPGQPEQLILANYLDKHQYVVARSQDDFDLAEALEASSRYKGLAGFKMDKTYLAKALDSISK